MHNCLTDGHYYVIHSSSKYWIDVCPALAWQELGFRGAGCRHSHAPPGPRLDFSGDTGEHQEPQSSAMCSDRRSHRGCASGECLTQPVWGRGQPKTLPTQWGAKAGTPPTFSNSTFSSRVIQDTPGGVRGLILPT